MRCTRGDNFLTIVIRDKQQVGKRERQLIAYRAAKAEAFTECKKMGSVMLERQVTLLSEIYALHAIYASIKTSLSCK